MCGTVLEVDGPHKIFIGWVQGEVVAGGRGGVGFKITSGSACAEHDENNVVLHTYVDM